METPLIQLDNVHKYFGRNPVLCGISLTITEGRTTAIIGKSGEGKSVLLKHIIGLLEPDRGEILYRGQPILKMNRKETRDFRSRMSYMFQGCALFDSMTVFENIALPLQEGTRLSTAAISKKVHTRLEQLDLGNVGKLYPSQISGGMMKRVAMARALVTDPELVLFDEPTTGLDPIRKNAVHAMISHYQKTLGFTALVVSHEIPDIFHIAQEIVMIDGGKVVFSGSSQTIEACSTPVVSQFIRGEVHSTFID
ncbi:ATP-binding cassette domain-containing protein [Desulfobotulus sp. H1]|uniref:ATP-binding cassette domain-containing protein n=1 Tax=Desulfobotulus pelophilus TaxID=2823377 RepID=A0ABT3N9K8_9BACT|nr:ATP-binding cassette domain-containing protein [Desulfobotulus pelophilus]MCW7754152.1 ATP-binding cassette domain-containing protein [Desulfobotulus pelophilus]